MRTIKRAALPLNQEKQEIVKGLCQAYCKEKRYWLGVLQSWDNQALLGSVREIRDQSVKSTYKSPYGLQARHWKLALDDAASTWDMYWQSLFVEVRKKIHHHKPFTEDERHYAYWLLKGYKQFASLMKGEIPKSPFALSTQKSVASYVRRIIRKIKKRSPTVKTLRIVKFDANCYEVFDHEGRQYIKIMTRTKGKRIVLPLLGKTKIAGNITLVLGEKGVEIHISQELKKHSVNKGGPAIAVDFGYTEVITDTENNRYGKRFGKILTTTSDTLCQKMQKRHKLHAIEKKTKNPNIKKYNLGRKKFSKKMARSKATLEREINTALNELLKIQKPSLLITEDLRHTFSYNKPKTVNRKLASWLRGTLQDRVEFKALAEGFRHEQVNPAYGSQICLNCGFVDNKNRKGDKFTCLYCRYEDIADRVAAVNYANRYADQEIGRRMPVLEVKAHLLEKFHRRLETGNIPVTVPGRTLDTDIHGNPPHVSRQKIVTAGRVKLVNQTVTQRAKQNKYV